MAGLYFPDFWNHTAAVQNSINILQRLLRQCFSRAANSNLPRSPFGPIGPCIDIPLGPIGPGIPLSPFGPENLKKTLNFRNLHYEY